MTEASLKAVRGAVRAKEADQRSASARMKTGIGRVHGALRAFTRDDHVLLDRMLLTLDLSRPEGYAVFLSIHRVALLALCANWRPDDTEDFGQMLGCLEADIGKLGTPAASTPTPRDAPASPCNGLGIAYVIRGSRLGAAVLRRGVADALPTSYLDFVPALSWTEFLRQLESIADDPSSTDAALLAARITFKAFATEFHRMSGVIARPCA
jgi:heme oxygenase